MCVSAIAPNLKFIGILPPYYSGLRLSIIRKVSYLQVWYIHIADRGGLPPGYPPSIAKPTYAPGQIMICSTGGGLGGEPHKRDCLHRQLKNWC